MVGTGLVLSDREDPEHEIGPALTAASFFFFYFCFTGLYFYLEQI